MSNTILYPGSFNPWHAGHQFVYDCAKQLVGFENVVIAIALNPSKANEVPTLYSSKAEFLKWTMRPIGWTSNEHPRIEIVDTTSIDLCKKVGANFMVRGIRPSYDLPQEAALDFWNRQLSHNNVKTLFFMPPDNYNHLSSSVIRELINLKKEEQLESFIDPYILARWKNKEKPQNSLYFGRKCTGKTTYLKAEYGESGYIDCDAAVWQFFTKEEKEEIKKTMRGAIESGNLLEYQKMIRRISCYIDWETFLNPENSYEVSALGSYFELIPPQVLGKFNLVKIQTKDSTRRERAIMRGCLETLRAYDNVYREPPFYDETVHII